jgi:hypothetical protein
MKVRPLLRYAALTVAGFVGAKLALLFVPATVVGLLAGLAAIGVLTVVIVRAATACTRGELESEPLLKAAPRRGEGPNARVQTRTPAHPQARAREAA